ncbi:hypothetical protein [Streptomyces fractus]|uniref:hypothetical protein n=1 Tax=Streptomyces fractus TaxID=641806 RepID=UPI003CFA4A05
MIPDSKVGQLDALLHDSGVLSLIDKELVGRPGPDGLPVRTVLVGLLLALHYGRGANLADAFRILADHLRPTARFWLGVPDLADAGPHTRLAFSRRVYRAFDRLTTALDPYRCERRRRLPATEALAIAAAWEDNEPERVRRRTLLQEISDRLVLVTVQLAHRRRLFSGWPGDIGALLVDGSLTCPAMPDTLVRATTDLDDKAVRDIGDDNQLARLIAARTPFFLKRKQNPDPHGTIRLQCPAAGPSPAVSCTRFHQAHQVLDTRPTMVDLTNPRGASAHTAAKPSVPIAPGERLRPLAPEQLPKICRQPTITLRPGGLGKIDKFRQDRPYLAPPWQDVYRPARANIEGLNGRAKSHGINIADPARRLAHGRVAQTILLALMITKINLGILHSWTQTSTAVSGEAPTEPNTGSDGQRPPTPSASGIPPPAGPHITETN